MNIYDKGAPTTKPLQVNDVIDYAVRVLKENIEKIKVSND